MDLDEVISALQSFRKHHGNVKEVFAGIKLTTNGEVNLSGWEYVTLLDQVESVAWIAADPDRVVVYTHSMTNSEGGVTLAAALGPQVTPRVAQKPPVQSLHDWARLRNEGNGTGTGTGEEGR